MKNTWLCFIKERTYFCAHAAIIFSVRSCPVKARVPYCQDGSYASVSMAHCNCVECQSP